MAKRGNLTNTGAQGLQSLRFVSFSQAATSSYVALGASFIPVNITVIQQDVGSGNAGYASYLYQFDMGGSVVLPAWAQQGIGIRIIASVTISGISYDVSGFYIIENRAANGQSIQLRVQSGRGNAGSLTSALTQTALDTSGGKQNSPTATLITQFQKAMFQASAGSVLLAPSVDEAGNAPYSVTVTTTSGEYEITAPVGAKFDLADWQIKQSGSGTMTVRFA